MARNTRRNSASSTDFENQLKEIDRLNARHMASQMERNEREFSNMLDKQQRMLMDFYRQSSESGRENIRMDMEERQRQMKDQLDSMKKSFTLYSQFMTKTERKTFEQMYNASRDGMAQIEKEMSRRFDGIEEEFEEMTETFLDKIRSLGEDLQDISMTLNLNELVQGMQDQIDSYSTNRRQVASITGDGFDFDAFSRASDSLTKSVEAFDRSRSSEFIADMIKETGIKDMNEMADYMETIASAEILGISRDDLSRIMWKDMEFGASGKWLRSMTNMAVSLGESEDLYVSSETILSKISQNIDDIYGLAGKDSKKATKMAASLATLEAFSENAENSGVESMTEMMGEWMGLTLPELMDNEQAQMFAAMNRMNMGELYQSLQDKDMMIEMVGSFQQRLQGMDEYEMYSWRDALGFDSVSQMMNVAGYDGMIDDMTTISSIIDKSFAESASTDSNLILDAANEQTGRITAAMNEMSTWGISKFFDDILGTFDMESKDLANISAQVAIIIKLMTAESAFKLFGKDGSIGKWLAGTAVGGRAVSTVKGAGSGAMEGAKSIGKALTGSADDIAKLGTSIGKLAKPIGVLGIAVDGISGLFKAEDWFGEGATLWQRASSVIGSVLGGTGPGIADEGTLSQKLLNVVGGALKGAGAGTVVGGPIGTAVGAIAGAVGSMIGGKNIATVLGGEPVEGYADGLSYVPNTGLAMLHRGEAVLTESQANIVRASADGGVDTTKMFEMYKRAVVEGFEVTSFSKVASNSFELFEDFYSIFNKKSKEDIKSNKKISSMFNKGSLSSSGSSGVLSTIFGKLFGSVTAFANGGIITEPTAGIVGEAGPEAVIPLTTSALSGGDNAEKIWNYLLGKGLTSAGAAGLMGNLFAESGLNSGNVQNNYHSRTGKDDAYYTSLVDRGIHDFVNDSYGYGIAQWTYWSRKENLLKFAKARGSSISDLSMQLDFLVKELSESYSGVWNVLKSTNSLREASNSVLHGFEAPKDQSLSVENTRASYGQGYLNQFSSYDVGTPWLPNDQVALIHEGEMIVPEDINPLNSPNISIPMDYMGRDDSETVETLKWMVYRLEAKLDKLISLSSRPRSRVSVSEDMNKAYSF